MIRTPYQLAEAIRAHITNNLAPALPITVNQLMADMIACGTIAPGEADRQAVMAQLEHLGWTSNGRRGAHRLYFAPQSLTQAPECYQPEASSELTNLDVLLAVQRLEAKFDELLARLGG